MRISNSFIKIKKSKRRLYFYLSCFVIILFSVFESSVVYGNSSVYGYNLTKITSVGINRNNGAVDIYTIGNPYYKGYLFKNGYNNFFILAIRHAILYGRGKKIMKPFKNIYSVSYSQFSVKPAYSVHIVVRETVFKRLNVSAINLGGNRYKLIINVSGNNTVNNIKKAYLPKRSIYAKKKGVHFNVFIDAGHGGGDPGGIGPMGLPEDFINLSIALKLKKILEAKGIKAEMDRTSNTNVSLQQRAVMANRSGANLFIGLYCNAEVVPYLYGTTAYYFHRNSYRFANFLNHYISNHLNLKYDGVLRDDLYVLRFTTMPAIIIEYGYISNPHEEHLLASSTFRHLIANGIANAIYKYFIIEKR